MPLIKCELNIILTWSENCILTDITTQSAIPTQGDNPARPTINAPISAILKITDTKLYVPVVTLSAQDANKFLEQLKSSISKNYQKCTTRLKITI